MEWHEQLLEAWVGSVLQVVNASSGPNDAVRTRLIGALQDVIDGGPGLGPGAPSPPTDLLLPAVRVRVLRRRTALAVEPPDEDARRLRSRVEQLHAIIMLMARDARARRLRRCDWHECRAFFFAARDHRREHSFCTEEHRRLFDLARRDPGEQAAYMRHYRAAKRRQVKTRKRRDSR